MLVEKGILEIAKEHRELIQWLYDDYKYVRHYELYDNAIDDFLTCPDKYLEDLEELYEINVNAYF
jgi:hypothetical protein